MLGINDGRHRAYMDGVALHDSRGSGYSGVEIVDTGLR